MLAIFFPRIIDNTYRGHVAGLWLFAILLALKFAMSLNSILNGRRVLISADGVPLDTYPAAAAQTIVAVFALRGIAQLTLALFGALALVRYRALVPLFFSLFLLEHLLRKLALQFLPIVRTGNPPASAVNLAILAIIVAGLACSLFRRQRSTA